MHEKAFKTRLNDGTNLRPERFHFKSVLWTNHFKTPFSRFRDMQGESQPPCAARGLRGVCVLFVHPSQGTNAQALVLKTHKICLVLSRGMGKRIYIHRAPDPKHVHKHEPCRD